MEKSLMVRYLQSMKLEELDRFSQYLHSPYFNKGQLVIRLFEFLRSRIESSSQKTSPSILSADAFKAIYPDQEFVPQRLRRVRMELTHHLESFFALESTSFASAPLMREYGLRQHLMDRGMLDLYKKRRTKKPLAASQFLPRETLVDVFLEIQHNEYFIHTGSPDDTLERAISLLDQFYLGQRLELLTSMINKERIYNREHNYSFLDSISEMIASPESDKWDNAQLWWHVFQLHFPKNSTPSFIYLNKFLATRKELLPNQQLRQIRGFMLNYINRTTESKGKYNMLWKLLKTMLEEGTLYSQGKINSNMFRATVRSACYADQLDWAEEFLKRHSPHLKGDEPNEQLELFGAMISFFRKQPEIALKKINLIKFNSFRNEIYLKTLQLMCTYTLQRDDDLFRLGEAFRKYLSYNKSMGANFSQLFQEFNMQLQRLGKINFLGRPLPKEFEKNLRNTKMAEKFWLLKQVEKLK